MIEDFPSGLIYRRAHPGGSGQVLLDELWDIEAPGCPMIRSPWHPQTPGRYFIRRVVLSDREYEKCRPPLFERVAP